MSQDGELTSHLPLMKAPTPVMLLGGPWECRDDSEEVWRHGYRTIAGVGFSWAEICSRTRGYAPSSHCSGALPPRGSRQRGRTERERALVRLVRAAPSVAGSIPTEASRSPLPTRLPCEFFPPNSLSSTAEPPEGG